MGRTLTRVITAIVLYWALEAAASPTFFGLNHPGTTIVPQWFDTYNLATTTDFYSLGHNNILASPVAVSQAGSATKLRIYFPSASSTQTFRLSLYDAGGTVLGCVDIACASSVGAVEGTLASPVSVTVGTYYVGAAPVSFSAGVGRQAGGTGYQSGGDIDYTNICSHALIFIGAGDALGAGVYVQ
jgi:hypothetical protein